MREFNADNEEDQAARCERESNRIAKK